MSSPQTYFGSLKKLIKKGGVQVISATLNTCILELFRGGV